MAAWQSRSIGPVSLSVPTSVMSAMSAMAAMANVNVTETELTVA